MSLRVSALRASLLSGTAIVSGTLAFVLFASVPQPAQAQCVPAPTSGGTVTCTGNPSGFTASDLTGLTVNAQNANFNGAFNALRIGTLGVTSTNSNFQAVTFTDIGNLTFTITGGNFNGPLTVNRPRAVHRYGSHHQYGNLQSPTFTGIDNLRFELNGGNDNGDMTVNQGWDRGTGQSRQSKPFSLSWMFNQPRPSELRQCQQRHCADGQRTQPYYQ